jgi:DNA-binding IclR family transcriptional regulator
LAEQLVKSAARVFAILEQFDRVRRPQRLKEIAAGLSQPVSSTAALLKSMTAQGYLSFELQTRAYLPTGRLARIVSWVPFETFEQGIVAEAMRTLQQRTNEMVVLSVEAGIYLEYVQTVRSTEGMQLYIAPGTKRLMVQTSTGWQFLNLQPRAHALAVYDATIAAGVLDERSFSRDAFLQSLEMHGSWDVSFTRARDLVAPTAHWDGAMVSLMIPVPEGHRPLALGVGGPAYRLEQNREYISNCLLSAQADIRSALAASA